MPLLRPQTALSRIFLKNSQIRAVSGETPFSCQSGDGGVGVYVAKGALMAHASALSVAANENMTVFVLYGMILSA